MNKKIGAKFSLVAKPKGGVTYSIRTNTERVFIPAGSTTTSFTSDCRFYRRTGEREKEAALYCVIFIRHTDGTRDRAFRVTSAVTSITDLELSLGVADEAIEIYVYEAMPASQQDLLTDYTAKKEIPVEKVAGTLRCRWSVGDVEQTTLSAKSDGTPRGGFPAYAPMEICLMVRAGNGVETVLTDTGSLTVYLQGTSSSFSADFSDAPMTYSLSISGSSLSALTSCTGLRAVWTTTKFGTLEFMLPKVFDGARGYSGPVPIPAGEWKSDGRYTATVSQAQYVYNGYDGKFYIVSAPETGTRTATVGTRPDQNLAQWTLIDTMSPLFTSLAIIAGGTVGKAVFWDEFMYSQYGRHTDGTVVDEDGGTYGAPVQAADAGGTFQPNFLINFLTGETVQKKATVEGTIVANSLYKSFKTIRVLGAAASGNKSMALLDLCAAGQGDQIRNNGVVTGGIEYTSGSESQPSDGLPNVISLVVRDIYNSSGSARKYCLLNLPPAANYIGKEIEIIALYDSSVSASYSIWNYYTVQLVPAEGGFISPVFEIQSGTLNLKPADSSITQKLCSVHLLAMALTYTDSGETVTRTGWMPLSKDC